MNQSADRESGIEQANFHVAIAAPSGLAEGDQRADAATIGELSGGKVDVDLADRLIHRRLRFGCEKAAIGRRQFSQVADAKSRAFAGNFHFTLPGSSGDVSK